MEFFGENLDVILRSIIVGILFGWCFAKINNLREELSLFKECNYNHIKEDVRNLERESYKKVNREQLTREVNDLTQRILIIETKMQEREKFKERS